MSWTTRITKRADYIAELRHHLARLPETERADILRDQEEFFREAILSGRTEADVIGSLGDPKQLAKTLIAESAVAASESAFRMNSSKESDAETSSVPRVSTDSSSGSSASFSTQMNATLRAFLAIITLAPFNLIFVLGPFLCLMGCLFAGWVIGAMSLVGSLILVAFIPLQLIGTPASAWAHLSSISMGAGFTMISFAFLAFMTFVTSWIARLSVRYLRWNLDMIAERQS